MSLETSSPSAVQGGGRGRGGRGAPFGSGVEQGQRRELRRPMAPASSPSPDAVANQLSSLDIKNSFNVEASEFVPKFEGGPGSLSVSAAEFVPGQYSDSGGDGEGSGQAHPSVGILYDAMYQLTLEPGRFDSIARKLTQDLNEVITDYETLELLAEIILENGINEPNFRYTGARLCDHLSLHLTVTIEGATLRQILMQKCNSLFKARASLVSERPDRLRGFILFLAELFQQLEIQVGAVVQRVAVLGDAIPELVTTLASRPERENIKCIVQTLKCCGSVLEEEERGKPATHGSETPAMDRCMAQLAQLSDLASLEPSLAESLKSLVKLRAANWGHSPPGSALPMQDITPGLGTYQLDPTFYAPDGEVLTMEEYTFLEEYGLEGEEAPMQQVQWSTGEEGTGMGDEIEAAYEEFLRAAS